MKKNKFTITFLLLIVIAFTTTACKKQPEIEAKEEIIKKVETIMVEKYENDNTIKTTAIVNAETQIDILATAGGTIKNLFFEVGDLVYQNKILATVHNDATFANLNNAQISYNNMQNNLLSVERIANENINQAKIGIQNAQEAIDSSQISLKSANTNLENAKALKEQSFKDTKENAIISLNNFINIIYNTLDQVNYIIGADDDARTQIAGIAKTLSSKNKNVLSLAKNQYFSVEKKYNTISSKSPNIENIHELIKEINIILNDTKTLVNTTISVIDNTVSSNTFSENDLNTQRTNFVNIKNNIISNLSSSEQIDQNMNNYDLTYNQEINSLENAVKIAENQLKQAQTNYENALISLKNAEESKKQQLLSSKTSIDNAKGSLDLVQVQTSDLNIKAPISGEITKKYVEKGTEINQGQQIAQISKTNIVKIEAHIPSEDIYKIKKGAKVFIQNNLESVINKIDSIADPITKKVRVEILFDNTSAEADKKLIPGTFVDILIETQKQKNIYENSIFIPLNAIKIEQTENIVFIYKDGFAQKVTVELGEMEGANIEIKNGLTIGDQIIVNGNKLIEDGEKIEIK